MTRPARILQVGLGARGRTWSRVVRTSPLAEPVAYVDPRPDAAAWAAGERGLTAPVFADLDGAARAVEADLALVVTPPQDRRATFQTLFARRLPVLCEKPLAVSLDDAAGIVRAAARAGLLLGVVQNFRYLPASVRMREIVGSGRYGPPTYATVLYVRNRDGMAPHLNKYPLVMDHPMLLEQSIHHLDLLRFVYGAEPDDVMCTTWNPPGSMYQGDACAAALIRLRGGPVVVYQGTWVSGSNTMAFQWRTDFARGVVVQRDLFGDLMEGSAGDAALRPVPIETTEPFNTDSRVLLEAFIRACGGVGTFEESGRDHLRTLAFTMACIQSARTGLRVSIPDYAAQRGLDDLW